MGNPHFESPLGQSGVGGRALRQGWKPEGPRPRRGLGAKHESPAAGLSRRVAQHFRQREEHHHEREAWAGLLTIPQEHFGGFADSFLGVVWAGSCARDGRPKGRDLRLDSQQPGRRRSRRRAQTRAKQTYRVQPLQRREARAGGRESGSARRRQSIDNGSGANARLKSVPSRSIAQATFNNRSATDRSDRA